MKRIAQRGAVALALLVVLLLGQAGPAYAHPDFQIADDAFRLAPGEDVSFPLSVHYHRLVGRFEVAGPAGAGVTVFVLDEETFRRYTVGEAMEPLFSAGSAREGRLNFLIECCLGQPYSPYRLVVRNDHATAAVDVRLRASLIHDELAVVVHDAEPGAVLIPGILLGLTGIALVRYTFRRPWREVSDRAPSPLAGRHGTPLLLSMAIFVLISLIAAALGGLGAWLYGQGWAAGLTAITSDIPVPGGPFGSRFSTLMGALSLAWLLSVLLWARGARDSVARGSGLPGYLGLVLAGGCFAWALLVGLTYASLVVPLGLAALVGLPLLTSGGYMLAASRATLGE